MNCFQFDYFCGYHTAKDVFSKIIGRLWIAFNLITFVDITQQVLKRLPLPRKLWIAFNLITFVDITQLYSFAESRPDCCELLSIWLLLWISHSHHLLYVHKSLVVNCFQFDYFCGYHTAKERKSTIYASLWIAFNLITFVDITQQSALLSKDILRCELLSIWLLLWISHSKYFEKHLYKTVVNCFQFDYFCGYHTASFAWQPQRMPLWIAFNLITFVDITQLVFVAFSFVFRCELLSIWLLLWISHSQIKIKQHRSHVVNCFQFDYFCGYHTATLHPICSIYLLWIAFNLITFVDITQHRWIYYWYRACCELLSIWLLLWISHSLRSIF